MNRCKIIQGGTKIEYIIGFDIGGTKCAVNLASVSNGIKLIDKITFPTNASKGYLQAQERLFASAWDILKKNNLTISKVIGIGVSCGGPLDSRNGIILSPPNLPGWDNIPFAKLLTEEFNVPAFIQNDANACALVEWKLGAGRDTNNMMFLTMGTGFGAGIISEGVLVRGQNDMAGEVGHIRLEDDGPFGFGKNGSIEGFCSGAGIGRLAQSITKQMLDMGKVPAWIEDGIKIEEISAKVIAEYANNGDDDAKKIYEIVGEKLGKALSIFIDILNPEKIVIGSIFVRSENLLRASMERVIQREALMHSQRICSIVPAQTGERIGDLASIITACYEMGIDPMPSHAEEDEKVMYHYNRLFERYPELMGIKDKIMDAYNILLRTYSGHGKLLVCGNGGSASDAEHIVGELMKGFYKKRPLNEDMLKLIGQKGEFLQGALPAISLTGHTAFSTAFMNDVDPKMVFAQQVYGYGQKCDTFLGISTSGNSTNVVNAAKVAKALGLKVIGMTGSEGGELAHISDVLINVPGQSTADIQEYHLPVYHTLCAMLEEEFFE
ncbi:MAG: ROK family protein (putative glucokinase) [Xylanivirga thermophila]|uniref:ROK family protein n=1 Tax=Xylanivirga thermophila TaxID=2496273 RepID=UPI00311EF30F